MEHARLQKGDLMWYQNKLLYCEGRASGIDRYLFVSPLGKKYELSYFEIEIYNGISTKKSSRRKAL